MKSFSDTTSSVYEINMLFKDPKGAEKLILVPLHISTKVSLLVAADSPDSSSQITDQSVNMFIESIWVLL